ncbi:MAG: UDP-N-acetylmuramate--L-alanine ligase [Patescibacteria group bacterium]
MGISVAGTHGKTTTTAMLATMLKENKLDPTYVIGTGDVGSLGAPGHLGKGKHFVAEADEYATEPQHDKTPRFLWQHPHIAIITNIEFDHPDIYGSIDAVRAAFSQFINKLPANGTVIAYGDDHEIRKMLRTYNKKVITYGFNPDNQYVFKRVTLSGEQLFFWIESHGTSLGQFRLHVSGEHNALNALAVIITGLELGVPLEKIRKGLLAFRGSKRRLEYIGETLTGAKVYDDYAHHPTEIKTIIKTLKQQYPKKHIIAIFQPHTYSRTKKLFGEFQRSFEDIDTVIITDIYASLREKPDTTVSAQLMIEGMRSLHREVLYLPQLSDVVKYINKKRYRANTVIVTMGAGDVYTIHSEIGIQDE